MKPPPPPSPGQDSLARGHPPSRSSKSFSQGRPSATIGPGPQSRAPLPMQNVSRVSNSNNFNWDYKFVTYLNNSQDDTSIQNGKLSKPPPPPVRTVSRGAPPPPPGGSRRPSQPPPPPPAHPSQPPPPPPSGKPPTRDLPPPPPPTHVSNLLSADFLLIMQSRVYNTCSSLINIYITIGYLGSIKCI